MRQPRLSAGARPVSDAAKARRHIQLLLLGLSTCAVTYSRFALAPLQESMTASLALTDNQMAWIQGPAVAIPLALGAIPAGLLFDRYSRVRLFLIFGLLNLIATVLTAFASSIFLLIAARCLVGFTISATLVFAYAAVADLYAPAQRGRATMVVASGEICGAPAAFALGGLIIVTFGIDPDAWRWSLLWMCVPLIPVAMLMAAIKDPARAAQAIPKPSLIEVWPRLWSFRAMIVPLLLGRIMVWIADGAVLVWGGPTFARKFGLAPDAIGAIMASVLLFSGILGPLLGGPLADLCQRTGGPRRTMTALCIVALLSAPTALFGIMPDSATATFTLVAFLTLGFIIGTAGLALAMIVIPTELRGVFVAISITVGALFCYGVAPVAVSALSVVIGGPPMIGTALSVVCAATSVMGAIAFGIGTRNYPRNIISTAAGTAAPVPALDQT